MKITPEMTPESNQHEKSELKLGCVTIDVLEVASSHTLTVLGVILSVMWDQTCYIVILM